MANANENDKNTVTPRGTDEHAPTTNPQPSGTDSAGRHVRPADSPTPPTMRGRRDEGAGAESNREKAIHERSGAVDLDDKVEGDEEH